MGFACYGVVFVGFVKHSIQFAILRVVYMLFILFYKSNQSQGKISRGLN